MNETPILEDEGYTDGYEYNAVETSEKLKISEEHEQKIVDILEDNFSNLIESTIFYPDGHVAFKTGLYKEIPFSFNFTDADEQGNRGVTISMKFKKDEKVIEEEDFINLARGLFNNIFTKELMEVLGG